MLIGAHVSAAGGVWNAPKNAADLKCECFQIFSRPPQGGHAPNLTEESVQKFKQEMKKFKFDWFVIHTPYFINFASQETRIRHGSSSVVREELERGNLLGAKYVMAHLGSFKEMGKKDGMKSVATGIDRALYGYSGKTEFLIEISAGAGAVIGDTFEELAEIIHHPDLEKYDIGICFDTQHAFASGYDLRTPESVDEVWKKAEGLLGKNRIKMSHCNDSAVELGGKKDRHEHIGAGEMGVQAFMAILEHKGFSKINFILETQHDKIKEDLKILKEIRAGRH